MTGAKGNRKKTHWLRNILCVLIACCIAGIIVSGIIFMTKGGKSFASSSIEFSFDGAANGIAPNGYPFDTRAITSDDVLTRALEKAGMADRYTVEQLRGALIVQGVYPGDIVDQMTSFDSALDFSSSRTLAATEYHPTLYSVQLNNGFDENISRADLENLLKCIMETYQEYFSEVYAVGTNVVKLGYNLENYDYVQQLSILASSIRESISYAEEMYGKAPNLMLNGKSFNDIAVQLGTLISTDVTQLNANVMMNNLTTNTSRLATQYNYAIRSLKNQLVQKKVQLSRIDALIASYDKNGIIYLSTSGSLTRIDGNSSVTYDTLVSSRKEVADQITEINSRIASYQILLDNLTGTAAGTAAAPDSADDTAGDNNETTGKLSVQTHDVPAVPEISGEQKAAIETGIADLVKKREAIMTDFAELIRLYNEQKINDVTVAVSGYRYFTPSVLSLAFAVQTAICAGVFCAVGFIVCLILLIRSRMKEEKEAQ